MRFVFSLALITLLAAGFFACSGNNRNPSGGITTSGGPATGGTVTTGTAAPTGGTTTTSPTGTGSGGSGTPGEVIPRDQPGESASPTGTTPEDDHLAEVVRQNLKDAGILPRYNITVSAQKGVVTLQGSVPDRTTENSIVDQVKQVTGVKDVQSRLNLESK